MTNVCKYCGKSFEDSKNKLFCSQSCSHAYSSSFVDHNKMKHAKCIQCGEDLYIKYNASPKNCLCEKCKTVHCKICGNVVSNGRKFCSDSCKKISAHIPTLIKYFGFNKELLGTNRVFDEYNRIKNELENDYRCVGLTSREISKKYNYVNAGNLVPKVFRMLGIKPKTFSQASLENWTKYNMNPGRHDEFCFCKTEWHKTWDGREVFLRSSYETDYANELDEKRIWYDVESLKIKYFDHIQQIYRCAIPDFYLKDSNTIVEIKSTYTYNEQNMMDKVKAYKELGYNVKLILDHKEYEL